MLPKQFILDDNYNTQKEVCKEDNLFISNGSLCSTTAGETSSDESIYESIDQGSPWKE